MLETDARTQLGLEATDDDVVSRVCAGEISLYEVIVRRYSGRMRRATRRVLSNEADVDEVIQEAHYRALCAIHQFAGRSSFSTWLTQIAIHVALARLRRSGTRRELSQASTFDPFDSIQALQRNPEQQLRDKETMATIAAAVRALPEHYRSVFLLRSVQELSTAEVALLLRISEPCARTRLHRAKGLLGNRLLEHWNPGRDRAAS